MQIPIFLISDNDYSCYMAAVIASIVSNHKTSNELDFYIVDIGIAQENKDKIKMGGGGGEINNNEKHIKIEFIQFDKKIFEKINGEKVNIKIAMCSRFLIPILKPKIKKCIYLDCDVIVLDDIEKLYNENLDNYVIGGCNEKYSQKSFYFNSGVLLIDCEKWRKENITDKLIEIGNNNNWKYHFIDQDILNSFFGKNYKILDKKYNLKNNDVHWSEYRHFKNILTMLKTNKDCVVRHYCGKHKPWKVHKINSLHFGVFWKYAKMTDFYEEIKQKYKDNYKIKNPIKRWFKILRNKF